MKVTVDTELAKKAQAIFEKAGTTLETWLTLQLKVLVRGRITVIHLTDIMPFGKYKDCKVEDIVRTDPEYMVWLIQNSKKPGQFGSDVLKLLSELVEIPVKEVPC